MSYILHYLSIKNLVGLIIILYFIIIFLKKKDNNIQATSKNYMYYLIKLDKYYLSNIYLTLSAVVLYFFSHLFFLFFLRYCYIGTSKELISIDPSIISLNVLISFFIIFILFIFVIVLVYYILDLLFFKEVLKMYIYLFNTSLMFNFCTKIQKINIKTFIGPIYLFFDHISHLNIELTIQDYDEHYFYMEIYENYCVKKLHVIFIALCKKNIFIHYIFIIIRKLLRIAYLHLCFDSINVIMPSLVIFFSLYYDIVILNKFYTIFYILFMLTIYRLFIKVYKFIITKDNMSTRIIYNYFYVNEKQYKNQRILFYNKKDQEIILENKEIQALFQELNDEDFKNYILNYLVYNFYSSNREIKVTEKNISALYQRFVVIILVIICTIFFIQNYNTYGFYILNIKIPQIILIFPLGLMCYFQKNTYQKQKNAITSYIYNKKYAIMFWIIAIIQSYIFYILIFKLKLTFITDEYLFDNFDIKILIMYTLEYKIDFFNNYFEFYARYKGFSGNTLANLILLKKEINYDYVVMEDTKIKEIKTLIEIFIQNYLNAIQTFKENIGEDFNLKSENINSIKPYMDCFSNMINLIVLWQFIILYIESTYLLLYPYNPKIVSLIYTFVRLINKYTP